LSEDCRHGRLKPDCVAGLLGVQVHVGPPMKIEYRNSRLKKLGN
jgi:hypothetical protein